MNSAVKNTKISSESIKGLAILVVLINHYINNFSTVKIGGFANTMVSVFFLLSGYGIFVSVRKRLIAQFSIKSLALFFRDRLVRLFPLYWIALVLQSLVNDEFYQFQDFLGLEAEGHYWFISAILQCYLFSPILAYALEKRKYLTFAVVTISFLFFSLFHSSYISLDRVFDAFHLMESPYLGMYFLHTYLFFLGMSLRKFEFIEMQSPFEFDLPKALHYIAFAVLFLMICVSILMDKLYSFPVLGILMLVLLWVAYSLRNRVEVPVLAFFGRLSFSLYLFHMTYYYFMDRVGILKTDSLLSVLIVLVVSPLFILLCLGLEYLADKVAKGLKNLRLA